MRNPLKCSKRQIFRATSYVSVILTGIIWNSTAAFADQVTQAISGIDLTQGKGPVDGSTSQGLNDFTKYIQSGFNTFYTIAGVAILLFLVLSGVLIASSKGSPQKRAAGFAALGMAILGAIIVGGAFVWDAAFFKFGQGTN